MSPAQVRQEQAAPRARPRACPERSTAHDGAAMNPPRSRAVTPFACVGLLLWTGVAATPTLEPMEMPQTWFRLEFRLDAIPRATNPFDPDAIQVEGRFTAPDGQRLAVPAFWYQGYTRRLEGRNEVLTADGEPGWRLRFLPTVPGWHTVVVSVQTNGVQAGESAPHRFEVAAPRTSRSRQGYVRVAANGRYFETGDGQALPLIGHCACWHHSRGTYDYDDWLAAMAEAGENYTRLWMAPWAFGIETEPGARLNYRLDRAWQLDHVFERAAAHGIYLMLCFDYHGMFETRPDYWGSNDNWKNHPYNTVHGGPCANQNAFFTEPAAQRLYQKRLRYLIARYGYSAHLLAWQFFNEIDNVYRYLKPSDVAAWHAAMGDWLKAQDPWKHLVTTSLTGSSERPEIWRLPQMEFAMYHSYAQADPAATLPGITHRFLERYAKPMMIGEFGTDWRGWRREQDPHLRGWRQGLWAGALSGSVGTSMSWWWESIHSEQLYPTFRAMHDFLTPTGWGQGQWEILEFAPRGKAPAEVGEPMAGEAPFAVTLPLDAAWEARLDGALAVADADAASQSTARLNRFVHGTAHEDLRIPFRLNAWLTNDARLVMRLNSVSGGAVLTVRVDGEEVFRRDLTDKDGGSEVNQEYNEDIVVELPGGRRSLEVRNAGADWFNLDWVRLENVLPAAYPGGWKPSPIAVGLRGERQALVYVVNPRASFPANATNAVVAPWPGATLEIRGLPAGRHQAAWFEPASARRLGETVGDSRGGWLTLPLPGFAEDLAGRIEPIP